jgi:hypothetical protein
VTRIVLTFGLISGGIMAVMFIIGLALHDAIGWESSEVLGYASIVLAFLLIFFGVRSYRDNVAGGSVSFGRAFSVGAMIALVGSLIYVATWQVIYFGGFAPDFTAKFQAHMVEEARASGGNQAEIDKKLADLQKNMELYQNPAINAAITLIEPLPVGLVIALISAGIVRRRRNGLQRAPVDA